MFPPLAFPCHGKGKDALGDGEYDVQDLARDCIRSQRRALPWEREGEGRRKAEEAFFVDGNRVSFYSIERSRFMVVSLPSPSSPGCPPGSHT